MGVTGIGGLFFRADDPEALGLWYRTHLGIGGTAETVEWCWQQEAGPTVFTPFRRESDYFPAAKQWMLNLRVAGLDALVDRLTAAGIAVERRAEWDDPVAGRFARIHDPEGNPIELWEPPADAS